MTMQVLQVEEELQQMVELYKERKPLRVLEIGVWHGGTLREWMEHARPGAVITAVDLHHTHRGLYDRWQKEDTDLRMVFGNSQQQSVIDCVREFGPFDWVFIDGDHSIEGVRADVENYLPMVALGGVLLMHDVVAPSDWEVGRFYPPGIVYTELARKYYTDVFCKNAPSAVSHGIGVVYVD